MSCTQQMPEGTVIDSTQPYHDDFAAQKLRYCSILEPWYNLHTTFHPSISQLHAMQMNHLPGCSELPSYMQSQAYRFSIREHLTTPANSTAGCRGQLSSSAGSGELAFEGPVFASRKLIVDDAFDVFRDRVTVYGESASVAELSLLCRPCPLYISTGEE